LKLSSGPTGAPSHSAASAKSVKGSSRRAAAPAAASSARSIAIVGVSFQFRRTSAREIPAPAFEPDQGVQMSALDIAERRGDSARVAKLVAVGEVAHPERRLAGRLRHRRGEKRPGLGPIGPEPGPDGGAHGRASR
jgi:hypothetical protein